MIGLAPKGLVRDRRCLPMDASGMPPALAAGAHADDVRGATAEARAAEIVPDPTSVNRKTPDSSATIAD
jgi:hypothetical protein